KDFSGVDGFTYSAINISSGETYSASVTLNVSFMNDAPVAAVDGPYSNTVGTEITVDEAHGLLANDMDVDGDELTVVIEGTAPAGLTLNQRVDVNGIAIPNSYDGSFTYAGTTATTFTYHANDGTADSNSVVVSLEPKPVSNIALIVQEPVVTGEAPVLVTSYRWIVQEDTTFHLDPLNPQITPVRQQQSLNFHKSSMPVIAQGCTDCYDSSNLLPGVDPTAPNFDPTDPANYENNSIPFNQVALDPNKYYYVSVLPNDAGTGQGHTIGGAQILPGQTDVTVIVNKQEIPTAQVSVFVFEDNAPTNGAVDGNEQGLGGFPITLEDAGGRYGISGGTMSQDAYGNPLKNALDCFQGYQMPPAGVILSCPNTPENQAAGLVGQVLIKDLPPGKYGVIALPPASEKNWTQTSTIEGTKVIDTWVKAAEPPYFVEFGLTGPHAFIGFVNPEHSCMGADPCQVPAPASTTPLHNITGNVTLLHDPRPPGLPLTVDTGSYDGLSYTRAWIGLNSDAGIGPSIATVQASNDPAHLGEFTIAGIPDGTYQLVVWDTYLDQIISFQTVTVAGGDVSLGNVGVPAWFTRTEHNVFLDDGCAGTTGGGIAGDGIRQDCEVGMPEQAINLRWRDGTVNQSYPTDSTGFVPFDQAFPFFSWQIYEVDYTRFKPTGVTVTVDAGGPVNETNILNPQVQNPAYFTAGNEACTDATCETRTETGSSVLLEAYQGFPGQTSTFDWGKVPYAPGENGGISGIVFYSSTRGEGDPRLTVGDPWEPGIASVKMRLYSVIQRDPNLVDTNVEPLDDFPNVAGGDIDVNGNGLYDGPEVLTLVQEVETDSWDKSQPTGCQGEDPADPFTVNTLEGDVTHCYDGFRNWNQVRPGVFDGGYAFNNISPGKYVVEAVLPPGYEQYKEQDMNVGFGDAYGSNLGPAPVSVVLPNGSLVLVVPDQAMILAAQGPQYGLAQPPCVGKYHQVPDELSLFPGEPAPFAQAWRPLCDRKEVVLSDQGQAAADFHFFTSTPVAAQFTGLITDDISNETNPNSPGFGEKWSPAYMPFTIRDFNDNIVYSGLGDAFGRYNGLLPSTFSANIPIPSGYSPAMMSACLNESGATKNNRYLSACYTGQFMPGTNTYLDTPILPTSAFAGGFNSPDCAAAEGAPVIAEVNGNGFGPLVTSGGTLTIVSEGTEVVVPNPAYEGPLVLKPYYNAPTITRDHGFGATQGTGSVSLVVGGVSTPLTISNWSATEIQAVA
ncbi:MAG: Ig-like domain-containing protein, partial [Thioalkalispiraceae bacterium]